MLCQAELRGLGAVNDELVRRNGRLVAISLEKPELSRRVVSLNKLPFPILVDQGGVVIRRFGLLHAGGGPAGADTAMPAQVLVAPDGRVLWRHQSARVQDRPSVGDILAALALVP